ncbi:integrase arm-type DNA-binding domain-containing protein [Chitinimonas viridis]|uniref:Integrase arm-type DNA-binding domain-containing protein n=1 Tax=Chitinimonas viridis TaxID=664880 RepID=A0ABT8B6W9_9NEIS|nr:integrase arm-type DNA-binding domain-containing protein [Chitinimonas viridis]MDN3577336.1 integrase arm-type DNA-binding domain-containing protein [Chitinimonas viridis]
MALSDRQIRAAVPGEKPIKLADGQGLFLLLNPNGSRYWRLKYRIAGKEKLLSLGVYPETSLSEARKRRDEARQLIGTGIDPSQDRKDRKAAAIQATEYSFESVAREWHQRSSGKWSVDHAARILQRLEVELFPHLGARPVAELKTRDLLAPLRKIEERGALDLASRVRQHIDGIMRYAVQTDLIDTNPARDMTGALAVRKTVHRPALPLERIPELLQRVEADQGRPLTKLALRFALLTFVRSSEFRFMRWDEIDLARATWIIPASREVIKGVKHSHRGAKMREPHIVPLSRQTLAVLDEIHRLTGRFDLVFAGDHDVFKPMSENTVNTALRRMGYDTKKDVCGHGFRAMACSALLESGLWSEDAIERQMSHKERNGVRAAYIHKAEFLTQRRRMVQWWADWLDANRLLFVSPHDLAEAGKA